VYFILQRYRVKNWLFLCRFLVPLLVLCKSISIHEHNKGPKAPQHHSLVVVTRVQPSHVTKDPEQGTDRRLAESLRGSQAVAQAWSLSRWKDFTGPVPFRQQTERPRKAGFGHQDRLRHQSIGISAPRATIPLPKPVTPVHQRERRVLTPNPASRGHRQHPKQPMSSTIFGLTQSQRGQAPPRCTPPPFVVGRSGSWGPVDHLVVQTPQSTCQHVGDAGVPRWRS
jgi:hypothetical protein